MSRLRRAGGRLRNPAQMVVAGFAAAILLGTALLMLPLASNSGEVTPPLTAMFTATSAVTVAGLVVVDTGTYWSGFGEGIILVLIQLGGFGIITAGSLFVLAMSNRLGLRTRLVTRTEAGGLGVGDLKSLIGRIAVITVALELTGAIILTLRFWITYDQALGEAAYLGVFHSVSAFNNAGFSPFTDSLTAFVTDPVVSLTVAALVIIGGIGFPVIFDVVRRGQRPRRWSLHTKITLVVSGALLVGGSIAIGWLEWSNPGTLGGLDVPDKVLASFFSSVMPRTAGFNTLDIGAMSDPTLLVTNGLMVIGGGSAGTAGGMKVTTFAVLGFVIWAELRGEPDVNLFRRRVPMATQRQAFTIALLSVGTVVGGALALGALSDFRLAQTLFEAASALGTVGLSTGITSALAAPAQGVLIVLMFLGRLGPATIGTALVLRSRNRAYRFPEERPIIG